MKLGKKAEWTRKRLATLEQNRRLEKVGNAGARLKIKEVNMNIGLKTWFFSQF